MKFSRAQQLLLQSFSIALIGVWHVQYVDAIRSILPIHQSLSLAWHVKRSLSFGGHLCKTQGLVIRHRNGRPVLVFLISVGNHPTNRIRTSFEQRVIQGSALLHARLQTGYCIFSVGISFHFEQQSGGRIRFQAS